MNENNKTLIVIGPSDPPAPYQPNLSNAQRQKEISGEEPGGLTKK